MCQLGLDVGLLSLLLGDGDHAVDSAQFDEGGVDERVVLAIFVRYQHDLLYQTWQ